MRTLKTLKPGQKGTKELLTRYGTSLLCIRYRYDETTGERVKTVELIVRRSRSCSGTTSGTTGRLPDSPSRRLGRPRRSRNAGRPRERPFRRPYDSPESRPPHPLPRDRPAPAGQVRRRPVGPGAPALALCAATRPSATACLIAWWRGRRMDVDAGWLHLGTSRVARCGRGVGRCGCWWVGLETACR